MKCDISCKEDFITATICTSRFINLKRIRYLRLRKTGNELQASDLTDVFQETICLN